MIPAIAWLLALAGCGRTPAELGACPDPACQQRWVAARIERDPAAVVAAVRTLPAGLGRDTLIQVLMAEWPEHSTPLCPELGTPLLRERCDTLTARPHLWQVDPEDPTAGQAGMGTAYPILAVGSTPPPHPWDALDPLPVTCAEDWTDNTCIGRRAVERAHSGQPQDAWRICLGAEQEKWRFECFFQVSEAVYDPRRDPHAALATELCLASGFYAERCLGHLAGTLGRWAPAASWDDDGRWRALDRSSVEVFEVLQRVDPALGQRWVALMWAYAMDAAYAQIDDVVGNPLDSVGTAAVPHLAAAVAWALWRAEGGQARGLETWVDRFEEAMQRRAIDPNPQPTLQESEQNLAGWGTELPGEEALPWTVYRGPVGRRAVGMDPRVDAAICILEAAARRPTPHRASLFREALAHPDATVRWTAARLAAERFPESLDGLDPATEPDPLVRARLERGLATRGE